MTHADDDTLLDDRPSNLSDDERDIVAILRVLSEDRRTALMELVRAIFRSSVVGVLLLTALPCLTA